MRKDELALWKLRADLPCESGEPRLRAAIARVHSSEVLRSRPPVSPKQGSLPFPCEQTHLIVDVDAVQIVLLHPSSHRVRSRGRVGTTGRGGVRRAKRGHDEADASFSVLRLERGPVRVGYLRPLEGLVGRSADQQKREGATSASAQQIVGSASQSA